MIIDFKLAGKKAFKHVLETAAEPNIPANFTARQIGEFCDGWYEAHMNFMDRKKNVNISSN